MRSACLQRGRCLGIVDEYCKKYRPIPDTSIVRAVVMAVFRIGSATGLCRADEALVGGSSCSSRSLAEPVTKIAYMVVQNGYVFHAKKAVRKQQRRVRGQMFQ
jgi:hypothetical protein